MSTDRGASKPLRAVENGVVIDGVITQRSHRFIEVEITSPFAGLRADQTIPMFAASKTTFLGAEGDRIAVELLKKLYRQAMYLAVHRDELKEDWRRVKQLLDELREIDPGADDEKLRKERVDLRHRFKRGLITQREYQRELKRLMRLTKVFEDRKRTIIDSFLTATYGLDLAQVLLFIGER